MATENLCNTFMEDRDYSCLRNFVSKFYQEVILIRKRDLAEFIKNVPNQASTACEYGVNKILLRSGLSGKRIKVDAGSNSLKGYVSKSKDDKNMVQYIHKIDILVAGVKAEDMCNLDALDHDVWVGVMQALDNTILVFGADNGLSTGDYDWDPVANSGATVITLQSDENAPERYLPLEYEDTDQATSIANFDAKFAAP